MFWLKNKKNEKNEKKNYALLTEGLDVVQILSRKIDTSDTFSHIQVTHTFATGLALVRFSFPANPTLFTAGFFGSGLGSASLPLKPYLGAGLTGAGAGILTAPGTAVSFCFFISASIISSVTSLCKRQNICIWVSARDFRTYISEQQRLCCLLIQTMYVAERYTLMSFLIWIYVCIIS